MIRQMQLRNFSLGTQRAYLRAVTGLAELKNKAIGFDRAEMRDVHIVKDNKSYSRDYKCL